MANIISRYFLGFINGHPVCTRNVDYDTNYVFSTSMIKDNGDYRVGRMKIVLNFTISEFEYRGSCTFVVEPSFTLFHVPLIGQVTAWLDVGTS